jgi:hypothetical protein
MATWDYPNFLEGSGGEKQTLNNGRRAEKALFAKLRSFSPILKFGRE